MRIRKISRGNHRLDGHYHIVCHNNGRPIDHQTFETRSKARNWLKGYKAKLKPSNAL